MGGVGRNGVRRGNSLPGDKSKQIVVRTADYELFDKLCSEIGMKKIDAFHQMLQVMFDFMAKVKKGKAT